MVKKFFFKFIKLLLISLLGFVLTGCQTKNTETLNNEINYKVSNNNLFDQLLLENTWDISFNGVIDNKLLFNIYEKDGTDIYKTIGLYYMDILTNDIHTIKEFTEDRIWDFKYYNGTLIYSKIKRDKDNPQNPYIVEVIEEKNDNIKLLDSAYIYDPQRTPSFQKIGEHYYYILESLLINDLNSDSSTDTYYSSFNKIIDSQKEIIFENSSIIENFSISSDQLLLSSTEFHGYNNMGVFLATKSEKTLLYILENDNLIEKSFDDIITNAWVLGDSILLKIRVNKINEEVKFDYKIYDMNTDSIYKVDIETEIFRVSNLDENKIVFIDDKNNTKILTYLNNNIEIKTLDDIPNIQSFYYNINKNSFFVYQYEYNQTLLKNTLYTIDLD